MLSVKTFNASFACPQGAPAPHAYPTYFVTIKESRPGEADEPRHLIRRAIYAVRAGKMDKRKAAPVARKVIGLTLAAALRAKALRGWFSAAPYDPLPDLRELRNLVKLRLRPARGEHELVADLLETLDACITDLQPSTAQRTGAA